MPVTDYTAAVSAFRTGDLDLVWFGGLTGVQARLQKPGARVLAQRDIDASFHSVFIANTISGPQARARRKGLAATEGQALHLRLGEFHLRPPDAAVLPQPGRACS